MDYDYSALPTPLTVDKIVQKNTQVLNELRELNLLLRTFGLHADFSIANVLNFIQNFNSDTKVLLKLKHSCRGMPI
jgi:hypothetical protein